MWHMTSNTPDGRTWLLLIYQLPARPAYVRVKIWRQLQTMGAIPLKNTVHALPLRDDAVVRFDALQRDITASGGEALILRAQLLAGLSDADVRGLFDAARDADYDELTREARASLAGEISNADLKRLRKRLGEIAAIDFFDAHGRQAAEAAIAALERKARQHPDVRRTKEPPSSALADLRQRVWVTRRGVHVDRIASAWLIRRFIDPEARFRFVDSKDYAPQPGELRFDMAEAEFTHEEDRCTFETLLLRAGLASDPALTAIAALVHELDIADGKFERPEITGFSALISGICAGTSNDEARIARGSDALDQFYNHFSRCGA